MHLVQHITPKLKKVSFFGPHPAFSLAYLDSLYNEAKTLYPELERDQVAVVSDGPAAGVAIEVYVNTEGEK